MGSLRLVAIVLLLGSPAFAQSSPTYGVGRAPTAEEIRALGACPSNRRIFLAKEVRVRFCLAHEQDIPRLEDR